MRRFWANCNRCEKLQEGPVAFLDKTVYPVVTMTGQNKGQKDLVPLVRILKECGAKRVYLFGSLAKGEARPGSDVDLACEGLSPERFFEALGKLLLYSEREVDLIDLGEAKEPLRTRIEREGILLYEAT